jgi:hypothetical protein
MTVNTPTHPLIPADRVNGADVIGIAGDKLGRIEDVAIEKISGTVAYAILSFGGVLGIGARYHPLPWKLLRYDPERRAYVAPLSRIDLKRAPTIDEAELSGWSDEQTRASTFAFYSTYGIGPYWG